MASPVGCLLLGPARMQRALLGAMVAIGVACTTTSTTCPPAPVPDAGAAEPSSDAGATDAPSMPDATAADAGEPIDAAPAPVDAGTRSLDLASPEDNAWAFLKARGSLDPNEEVVFYWTGEIFADIPTTIAPPGGPVFGQPLLKFEGFNIARFTPAAGGTQMLSRELALYLDPSSGEVLDCWPNPLNGGRRVRVLPVLNDPVNFVLGGGADYTADGEDVTFSTNVFITYRSPLPVASYPSYSASDAYQSSEMFNFFVRRSDLEYLGHTSVPARISWVRVGQYLPWMQLGQAAGRLVYHTRGRKLLGGFSELPQRIREYVSSRAPDYEHAPSSASAGSNATSWRYFKAQVDQGTYTPECD